MAKSGCCKCDLNIMASCTVETWLRGHNERYQHYNPQPASFNDDATYDMKQYNTNTQLLPFMSSTIYKLFTKQGSQ